MGRAIKPGPDRFALRREPNGVYLADGRVIPVADNSASGIDDGQLVVPIHSGSDGGVSLIGAALGVNVEERKLELVPSAE